MKKSASNLKNHSFVSIASSRKVLIPAIRIAVIVGTVLALINHGDKIFNMALSLNDCLKIILTYLVPYCVSTWSAVAAIRASKNDDGIKCSHNSEN